MNNTENEFEAKTDFQCLTNLKMIKWQISIKSITTFLQVTSLEHMLKI